MTGLYSMAAPRLVRIYDYSNGTCRKEKMEKGCIISSFISFAVSPIIILLVLSWLSSQTIPLSWAQVHWALNLEMGMYLPSTYLRFLPHHPPSPKFHDFI